MEHKFPENFIWGVASASYQIEGGVNEGGRGETIWDRYCHIPGNVLNGDTGDVACDAYHRYKEDIALMKQMGIKGYRFSIAWSRILPEGKGKVNDEGIKYYSDLIDELLAAGITPFVTMYHWDLPQSLQDLGGWANPAMPQYFLEYAKIILNAYGDRVKNWITLNEPYCAAFLGNYVGRQAPGIKDFSTALRVAYFLYVGHGLVVKYFREHNIEGEIGIALNLMGRLPYSDKPEDIEAARVADGYLNRWFIEPIINGKYPEDMISWYKSQNVILPPFDQNEIALMNQKLDFIGLNYYNDFYVEKDNSAWPINFKITNPKGVQVNSRDWPITEKGFSNMLLRMKNEYGIEKILITENGTSTMETVSLDHQVEDTQRVDYLKRHIKAMHDAIAQGVNIFGYMQWSFSDNFEWSFGYGSRFGLVYIDFETQERIIKSSGHFYSDLIKRNSLIL